ncbi:thioredoxin [Dendryphion nanum]|uniref:Thioredoxin n=1 Tax=Dendryphion nanum TaxID=256645 RepID=A0A9P9EK14_9PLEO|nr:thioredoxin [Dendryphion nanum]
MTSNISSQLHFRTLVGSNKYLIADFYANWCPPCKAIAPVYEQLSKANTVPGKLSFAKINVDEQPEVAAPYEIRSIPTFIVFKDGKPIETIQGANTPSLKKAIEKVNAEIKAANEKEAEAKTAKTAEEKKDEVVRDAAEKAEEQTVSGSYGMTGGNNWKMSLN